MAKSTKKCVQRGQKGQLRVKLRSTNKPFTLNQYRQFSRLFTYARPKKNPNIPFMLSDCTSCYNYIFAGILWCFVTVFRLVCPSSGGLVNSPQGFIVRIRQNVIKVRFPLSSVVCAVLSLVWAVASGCSSEQQAHTEQSSNGGLVCWIIQNQITHWNV